MHDLLFLIELTGVLRWGGSEYLFKCVVLQASMWWNLGAMCGCGLVAE